jgi:type III restriction enzyme
MLLQLRNVSSESLNIQTMGRIMRNPIPTLEKNSITNKYYLYSNYQESTRDIYSYSLKKEYEEVIFPIVKMKETLIASKNLSDYKQEHLLS